MAEIQLGTGVVWGTDGVSFSGTGVHATGKVRSVAYSLDGEWQEIRGQDGKVITVVIPDSVETIEVEVIPTGATKAAAIACYVLPARAAQVTFTDTGDAELSSGLVFAFMAGKKNKTNTGEGTLSMTLKRYDAATLAVVS